MTNTTNNTETFASMARTLGLMGLSASDAHAEIVHAMHAPATARKYPDDVKVDGLWYASGRVWTQWDAEIRATYAALDELGLAGMGPHPAEAYLTRTWFDSHGRLVVNEETIEFDGVGATPFAQYQAKGLVYEDPQGRTWLVAEAE